MERIVDANGHVVYAGNVGSDRVLAYILPHNPWTLREVQIRCRIDGEVPTLPLMHSDYDEQSGTFSLFLKDKEAIPLRAVPQDRQRDVVRILNLVDAVEAMHRLGLVHGSITEESVLLDPKDSVYLSYFVHCYSLDGRYEPLNPIVKEQYYTALPDWMGIVLIASRRLQLGSFPLSIDTTAQRLRDWVLSSL
jgi:hypothetical protein